MRRYDCLEIIAALVGDEIVVTNLANTASEWHALRPNDANLYCVGMGLVTSTAAGVALALPEKPVTALDGDGGLLFDASVLGVLTAQAPTNLRVVVFDNGGYVSTGPLSAVASMTSGGIQLEQIARAFGMTQVVTVATPHDFRQAYRWSQSRPGPHLIIAKVSTEQAFVGPLPLDLKENKYRFVRHVEAATSRKLLKPSGKEHGAAPKPDEASAPVTAQSRFAEVFRDGLLEIGTDFAVGLPCSGLSAAQRLCAESERMTYVPVAHEGAGMGLCAGAWLGGRRPAALIENFGLFASVYHLMRGHVSFGIPTLVVTEYRGDIGDQEFFAETGEFTEDLLRAMRINYRVIDHLPDLKPAIRDAWRWMDACLRPFAILPRFALTRPRAPVA